MKIVSFSKSQRWLVSNDGVDCADCYAEMWLVILEVFGSWNSDAFLRLRGKNFNPISQRIFREFSMKQVPVTLMMLHLLHSWYLAHRKKPSSTRPTNALSHYPTNSPPWNVFYSETPDWWEAVRTAWRRSCLERSRSILTRWHVTRHAEKATSFATTHSRHTHNTRTHTEQHNVTTSTTTKTRRRTKNTNDKSALNSKHLPQYRSFLSWSSPYKIMLS